MKLRYLDLSTECASAFLLLPRETAEQKKLAILERLRITPLEGEKPLHAWIRTMCEENGVPFTLPSDEVRRAMDDICDPALSRFVFCLA